MSNGEKIKIFRGHVGWSQQRLSLVLGISQSRMSLLERNLIEPTTAERAQLEILLGQPLATDPAEAEHG